MIYFAFTLLQIFEVINGINQEDNPFCETMCKEENVACEMAPCRLHVEQCVQPSNMLVMKRFQRSYLFMAHNKIRNEVAGGLNPYLKNLKASNMKGLTYSMELEFLAQCAANMCPKVEDKCRATQTYDLVSQNVYVSSKTANPVDTEILEDAVNDWYSSGTEELKSIKRNAKQVLIPSTKSIANLLYYEAETMGCGRVRNKDNVIIVCNYAPGLDVGRGFIFEEGEPCQSCSCGIIFPFLCGKTILENESSYNKPFQLGQGSRNSNNFLQFLIILFINYYFT